MLFFFHAYSHYFLSCLQHYPHVCGPQVPLCQQNEEQEKGKNYPKSALSPAAASSAFFDVSSSGSFSSFFSVAGTADAGAATGMAAFSMTSLMLTPSRAATNALICASSAPPAASAIFFT